MTTVKDDPGSCCDHLLEGKLALVSTSELTL